jgi:hypothetical protein
VIYELQKYRKIKEIEQDNQPLIPVNYLTRFYKPSVYWWELVNLFKRMSIILVSSFSLDEEKSVKYFIIFFLLLFFLLLEIIVFPYSRTTLMRLSIIWNSIALFVFISDSLLFKSRSISDSFKSASAFTLVILISLALIASTFQIARSR